MTDNKILLEKVAARVNSCPNLVWRGRFINLEFLLNIGDGIYYITVDNGELTSITQGALLMRPWRFSINIQTEAWKHFCEPIPRPGYQDLFGMCKLGVAEINGDIHPLISNLRYFKELLGMARMDSGGGVHAC